MNDIRVVPYARLRRGRRLWRTILLVLVLIGACVSARVSYSVIRKRVERLANHPWLRPVDWPTVLTSPALLGLAWKLSSDRSDIARFSREAGAVEGISLFGTDPNSVKVDLQFPLSYVEGQLRLEIILENTGSDAILVPPLAELQGHVSKTSGFLNVSCSTCLGWFSSGARVIEGGSRAQLCLSVEAPEQPMPLRLYIRVNGRSKEGNHRIAYRFVVDGHRGMSQNWARWEDIEASAMQRSIARIAQPLLD